MEERRLLAAELLVHIEATDLSGIPVDTVEIGSDFLLRTYVQDVRTEPQGVKQAFFDVNYDAALMSINGSITPGPDFADGVSGDTSTAGLIDEVGGLDTDQIPNASPGADLLLFTAPFHADAVGTLGATNLTGGLATLSTWFFDSTGPLQSTDIQFLIDPFQIVAPGISVTPTGGLVTTEGGNSDTLQVSLDTQPTADVSINLASSDLTEGTVSPSSLVFTSGNWNTPQTVTVTGVDDSDMDGAVGYLITFVAVASDDLDYDGRNVPDVTATNVDDDMLGVTVVPTSGLKTTEDGGTAEFRVLLNTQPAADVTIQLASDDDTEGTASVSDLTFTTVNWNVFQSVTVTGADDFVIDGNVDYAIITSTTVSTDAQYDGLGVDNISLTNEDNDVAEITVISDSPLVVTETGTTASFSIGLTVQPTADVTMSLFSSAPAEGTLSVTSVTFTPSNWVPQTVTVTGVDDFVDDGDVSFSVIISPATSDDPEFDNVDPTDVPVTNIDNDTAAIQVSPGDLSTAESGISDSFQVVLTSQPLHDVTLGVLSSNGAEGTVSPTSLTFTADNWDLAQTVTVTGVDDDVDDPDQDYQVVIGAAASADPNYDGVNPDDVNAVNLDDDTAGVAIDATSPLTTTEIGGTATFDVVLTSRPTEAVTIHLLSDNVSEGTASPAALVFAPDLWDTPQTVTVTGVDDLVDDGDQSYSILASATSVDALYDAIPVDDVIVTNVDDDQASVDVSPSSGLITTESGGTATFAIALGSQPTSDVTINLLSDAASEGTVSTSSLTFTAANWNVAQEVTVTGVDDARDDGDQAYMIATSDAISSDPGYSGLVVDDVSLTNTDDDTVGISVEPEGLVTTELGGSVTMAITLDSEPSANVVISLASSDPTEGTVTPSTMTFTPSDWDVAQTITVSGVDDADRDGDTVYVVEIAPAVSDDLQYHDFDAADIPVTNVDNETPEVTVTPATVPLVVDEAGRTATFEIGLTVEPTSDVTMNLYSSAPAEGTVSVGSVTFTPADWAPQTITVTGVDDAVDDDDVLFSIIISPVTSSDAGYHNIDPVDVAVQNMDDDTAGIDVQIGDGLTTVEYGATDTFQVVLTSQPTADVSIGLSTTNEAEGVVMSTSIVFSPENWNTPQTVTVTGVDEVVDDGDQSFEVVIEAATSSDPKYDGLDPDDLAAINEDNDTAGIALNTSHLHTDEGGGSTNINLVLTSQPSGDVTVDLSSTNTAEGTIVPSSITFTPENWNLPQTAIATGVDDLVDDGDQPYIVMISPAVSSDILFDGYDVADVALVNMDDDMAEIIVTPISVLTLNESGGTALFDIRLGSQPTSDVTIGLFSLDPSEGTISVPSVIFTSVNWNVPQAVTVTGVDDDVADGDVSFSIAVTGAISEDAVYNGMDVEDVAVVNQDDDQIGVEVFPVSGLVTTEVGGTASLNVRLISEPTADVIVSISSSDLSEGTVAPEVVTFTSANWSVAREIVLSGVDDDVRDGNVNYSVEFQVSSGDANFDGLAVPAVSVSNVDNETPAVILSPTTTLEVSEAATSATFDLVLTVAPTADVTIGLTSSDEDEGVLSTNAVVFTPTNWDIPQSITVTGVNDDVDDGTVTFSIITAVTVSDDTEYSGLEVPDVSVQNVDDDVAGVEVILSGELLTVESGTSGSFDIALTSEPTADVTIAVSSSDLSEGTVAPVPLVFTSSNWNTPQTITVTGQDDFVDDGAQNYQVVIAAAVSDDPMYDGIDAADVPAVNEDDDTAGVSVNPTSGLTTSEGGGTATFDIVLNSQPTADVTISVSSDNTNEGTVSSSSLVFGPGDWDTPQTITVTGVDDSSIDGVQSYTVVTAAAVSSDPLYDGMPVDDVTVANQDDDVAGVTVLDGTDLSTSETGDTATFQLVLASQPTSDVILTLSSSNLAEGTVGAASVIFTASDWNTPQNVQVTGVDDLVDDGDVPYAVTISLSSSDTDYDTLSVDSVSVTNTDDDTAGVSISPTTDLTTSESGGLDSFDVVLTSQPTADVTVTLASSDTGEGTLSVSELVFSSTNWDTPQTVTVTGVDDTVVDGDIAYQITAIVTGDDPVYTALIVEDTAVTNSDDDSATLSLTGVSTSVVEGTDATTTGITLNVTLTGAVEGGFNVNYSTDDGTATAADNDYQDDDGTLAFAGTDDETHLITIQVNHDNKLELDELLSVTLGGLSGITASAAERITVEGSPLAVTILNDDASALTISDVSQLEGASGATEFVFDVTLSQAVQGGFHVAFDSSDGTATVTGGDYQESHGQLSFSGTANEVQTITVQVNGDGNVERHESFGVTLGAISQLLDPSLASLISTANGQATGSILNDDAATVSFEAATSSVEESMSSKSIIVKLNVPSGGTIGESVVVNISDTASGTATNGTDYTLTATTVTFAAGSSNGDTQTVNIAILADDVVESDETIILALQVDAMDGAVTVGTPGQHTLAVLDDSATGGISGSAWIDGNQNGIRDGGELVLPGVFVTLTGETSLGQIVEITTMTGANGGYRFSDLPAGSYTVAETQPLALYDGRDSIGTVNGSVEGQAGNDRFSAISLAPGEQGVQYNFGELGWKAGYATIHMSLASTALHDEVRVMLADVEQMAGNAQRVAAIRRGESVQVRRIGPDVTVLGTPSRDIVKVMPAGSQQSGDTLHHTIIANGFMYRFLASEVDHVSIDGNGGDDELELHDSSGGDSLEATSDTTMVVGPGYRLDAIAFDLVRAVSKSGGTDTAKTAAADFVFQMEGDWDLLD